MTSDVDLADRVRSVLAGQPDVVERRMFGGLAFLVGGRLAVATSSQGGLLVRVDPGATTSLVEEPSVARFRMRGREVDGWLQVGTAAVTADGDLRR